MAVIAALPKGETTGEENAATDARSRLYLLLSQAVSFPERDLHSQALAGAWHEEVSSVCAALPYRLTPGAPGRWRVPAAYDDFQSEYIRLFEVGARGRAPFPLNSGHHTQDRMRTMEELVRFYNFFGLKLAPGHMPDHASVEFEFMHYLASKETEAAEAEGRESYLRAQRDFLERQLLNWWPRVAAGVRQTRAMTFFKALAGFIVQFLEADLKHIRRAIAAGT